MTDGPWIPRRPARARAVAIAALALIAVVLIAGSRSAFNGGERGDFPIYFRAATATAHGESLESAATQGYLAPPLCSAVMAPLAFLSQGRAAVVWMLVTLALFASMLWFGAREISRRWGLTASPVYSLGIALAGAVLSFGQLRHVMRGGQVDGLLVAGFVFSLVFLDRRPLLAGLAVGFGANIKFTAIVLIPYLLFRRRFAAAAWSLLFTVAFAFLPALLCGWENNLTNLSMSLGGILKVLGVQVAQTTSNIPAVDYYRSVSITSVISRFALDHVGQKGVYGILGATAGVIAGASWLLYRRAATPLWLRPRPETPDSPAITTLEWSALVIAVMLFSPQTQVRHMVLLLIPHMTAAAIVLRRPRAAAWLVAGLVVEQCGLHLPPTDWFSEATVDKARAVGWTSWCLLVFFLTLLGTGLSRCREMREDPATSAGRASPVL